MPCNEPLSSHVSITIINATVNLQNCVKQNKLFSKRIAKYGETLSLTCGFTLYIFYINTQKSSQVIPEQVQCKVLSFKKNLPFCNKTFICLLAETE